MTFLATLPPPGPARDRVLLGAIAAGNLDPVTWHEVGGLLVSARYLTIGGETVPMVPAVAQAAVDSLGASLPTVEVVEATEAAPGCILAHLPAMPADGGEQSSATFARCEAATRAMLDALGVEAGALVAAYRKDVVTPAPAGRVAIFGARGIFGGRVQPLFAGHGAWWADYSHGVRAVRGMVKAWRYPLPWERPAG